MNAAPSLIFDFGSHTIKAGISTHDTPDFIIPSVFPSGEHNHPLGTPIPESAILDDAVANGEVNNEDRVNFLLATVFNHYFPDESMIPDDLKLVMTETPFSSTNHTRYISEVAFELLGAECISIKPQSVLAVTQHTLPTALCLDIGHDIMQCVPMAKEYVISPAMKRSHIAGSAMDLFSARCQLDMTVFDTYAEFSRVHKYKMDHAKIHPRSYAKAIEGCKNEDTILNYTCGEILFKPSLIEAASEDHTNPKNDEEVSMLMESYSAAEIVQKSIVECDLNLQALLWSNIFVTGGVSKMSGFKERFQYEIEQRSPPFAIPHIIYPEEDPIISAWKGGALTANYDDSRHWISRDQYDENPHIVFEKFRLFGTSTV